MTQLIETHQKIVRRELEQETLRVQLSISTTASEKFVNKLENLCEKYSVKGNYFFNFK
jgi:hypothetical protein